jgi:uncharacterized membrane protein
MTPICPPVRLFLFCCVLCALFGLPDDARADFRVCNNTQSRVGIAAGYHDGQGWVTEGWFNLRANRCDVILKGDLTASYYYVHAIDYDRGGEWGGTSIMCTREKEFTIKGNENCLARGFDRAGFFEINTGQQRSWTVELNDANRAPGQR